MSLEVMSRDVQEQVELFKNEEFSKVEDKLSTLQNESNERIETFCSRLSSKFQKELLIKKTSTIGVAKSQSNTLLLASQKKVFNQLKKEVEEHFITLLKEETVDFYNHLYKRAKEIISVKKIICSPSEKALVKKLVSSSVVVEESQLISKGLIFENKEGDEIIDLTLKILLSSVLKDEEDKIISLLLSQ